MEKVNILGVHIDKVTMEQAYNRAMEMMQSKEKTSYISTPNSEFLYAAKDDKEFKDILNSADMLVADGIGVVYASKILKNPVPERVAGYDLFHKILAGMENTDKSLYLFGSAPGVAEEAIENLKKALPNLKISGFHNGYFKDADVPGIIDDINRSNADLLMVCMSFPKQEKWIFDNKGKLNVSLAMGLGGTMDGIAGRVKRAPIFYQKHGLEWFYRLIKQPSRVVRMLNLPKFGLYVLFFGRKYKD